jgi:hypothetical protein
VSTTVWSWLYGSWIYNWNDEYNPLKSLQYLHF